MDDVVRQLEAAGIAEPDNVSSFENLYKNRGRVGNQEERRRDILDTQRGNRHNKLDRYRGILELVNTVEEDIFQQPRTYWNPTVFVSGFTRVSHYSDILMMSEWMYEKPSDFAENWLAVLCPKGTRMLVVAHKGTTKCFNMYGNFRFECRTALPGGNPCGPTAKKCTVVLDCFYAKNSETMYVLDILAWNSCVMTEGETAFRHFWMQSQFDQMPELSLITKKNKLIFKIIPKIPCDSKSLSKAFSTYPYYDLNYPAVDGLLFYHSKAHYFSGVTPLVGWLFPYMVNEVLGEDIKVHDSYMAEKPNDYETYLKFIEIFEKKSNRRRQAKMFGGQKNAMEAEPAQAERNGAPEPDSIQHEAAMDASASGGINMEEMVAGVVNEDQ